MALPRLLRLLANCLLALILGLVWPTTAPAQNGVPAKGSNNHATTGDAANPAIAGNDPSPDAEVTKRLDSLSEQLFQRRQELAELRRQLARQSKGNESPEMVERAAGLQASIKRLNETFAQIATDGLLAEGTNEKSSKSYDWQQELLDVVRPILSSLKELTEKPRRIEELRLRIEKLHGQVSTADQALLALKRFDDGKLQKVARSDLDSLRINWQNRRSDAQNEIEVARIRLASLDSQKFTYRDYLINPVKEFFAGRGLTLLIALMVAGLLWYFLSSLFSKVQRWLGRKVSPKGRRNRERAVAYVYRAGTIGLILMAVLVVFYVRSDMLLLAISLLLLGFAAVALRHLVPRYLNEMRLLLNLGAVREGERLNYHGLPMEVRSINPFTILKNPALEGIVRLPLSDLGKLVSRPVGDEPWFPTKAGDAVLQADGTFAIVERQTIDTVRLRVGGALSEQSSVQFLGSAPRNLSAEGFTLAITFGLDYQHQEICLDVIPATLQHAVRQALADSPVSPMLRESSVQFKEATASSLDYLVLVSVSGEGAAHYFGIGRIVQRALVAACNEQAWVIPFSQLTVHAGDGFASPA